MPDCAYEATSVELRPGSAVVFYTDGAVEAMNARQEMYGFERFLESVDRHRNEGAAQLLESLFDDIQSFVGTTEQHDDITIIVARIAP